MEHVFSNSLHLDIFFLKTHPPYYNNYININYTNDKMA